MDIPEQETNTLSREQWTEWRDQRIKYTPNSKFVLKDMLFFHVPIEPENIQEIKSDTDLFMTKYSNLVKKCSSTGSSNGVTLSSGSSNGVTLSSGSSNGVTLDPYSISNAVSQDAIPISPVIFIFHSLTTLFFFFHEIPNTMKSDPDPSTRIKTIHKTSKKTVKINVPNKTMITKKIRITRKQTKE
jgi:hypothetical protein